MSLTILNTYIVNFSKTSSENRFLVSKETVVLRRWGRSKQKFVFINSFDKTKLLSSENSLP